MSLIEDPYLSLEQRIDRLEKLISYLQDEIHRLKIAHTVLDRG